MTANAIENFLEELNAINTNGRKNLKGNTEANIANTIQLLKVGDDLFDNNAELQEKLKNNFRQNISGNTYIEETFDDVDLKRPVIDLVQQGGTMLGIALLGYTYIMEKAGVRFRSMAGTSAGAINTLLLSALPEEIYQERSPFFKDKRQAVKSEFLAYLVANKDFFDFLDRRGTLRRVQRWLINRINVVGKIIPYFLIALPVMLLLVAFFVYKFINGYLFTLSNGLTENEIRIYNFITGTLSIAALFLLALFILFRLLKTNMGINPGEEVYKWITSILETKFVNIKTTADLKERKRKIRIINDDSPIPFNDPRMVFITANLTHNRIVKFPDNNADYWNANYTDLVSPAAYVRASMSLPFIFYAFIPQDRHVNLPAGSSLKRTGTLHTLARFVDGGMLSNFPIREFHVPPPIVPRYPTFGVLLGSADSLPNAGNKAAVKKAFWAESVFKFVLSFISTFRNFYDKDFLKTHPEFQQLVKAVDTKRFNSLDFGMTLDTKMDLFKEGANTAIQQLVEFKWPEYIKYRQKL